MEETRILDEIETILHSSAKDFPTCVGKKITRETKINEDLDFDDLDWFYLLSGLGKEIPRREYKKFRTIGELEDNLKTY